MELDDYIKSLNSDLERQMADLNRSVNAALNMGAPSESDCAADSNAGFSFCPECGSRVAAGCMFCPECGTRIGNEINETDEDSTDEFVLDEDDSAEEDFDEDMSDESSFEEDGFEHLDRGIIFTDTMALAGKYGIERSEVVDMFDEIFQMELEYGKDWAMLDVADYNEQLGKNPFWLDYNNLLSEFIEENDFPYGMNTPVFIVGGDDVIPIPMVEDLFGSSDNRQMPCDMCYCFAGNFFSDLWDGDHTISEQDVRNVIGRLPLEDGDLDTDMGKDILGYFDSSEAYYEQGIASDNVMMTANASWLPASKTMSEHLPLVDHAEDPDMVKDGMYVSPPVTPDNEDAKTPLKRTLLKTNILLFNLHGANRHGMSGFYNDEGEAFNTGMLDGTWAHVLNTVACYGARYHGYDRDDSMLLTSMHDYHVMLYAGSLIPVPMIDLDVPDGVEVHEGSGSEHLMPIYCMEQYAGLPAGMAMMKAKLEYFNTFRHFERDDFSMATMQMFSLYGNPLLCLQRNEEVLRKAKEAHVLPVLPKTKRNVPVRMKQTKRIMSKDGSSSSLLSDLQGAVNANLDAIHSAFAKDLYAQLGLEPRMIDHIDAYSIPNGDGTVEKGFMYAYQDEDKAFANKTWVEITENGKLKRVIKSK